MTGAPSPARAASTAAAPGTTSATATSRPARRPPGTSRPSAVAKIGRGASEINLRAADLVQRYGFNSFVFQTGLHWLEHLHEEGVLGPGTSIPSDLPWEKYGTLEFAEKLDPRPLPPRGHRGGPRRRLGPGGPQVGPGGGPAHGRHAVLLLGLAGARLRPPGRAGVGLRQHPGRPGLNEHCFNLIFTTVSAAFAFAMPMRIEAGRSSSSSREALALRQGPARGPRLRRRQHVLGGRRPARPLAPPLHAASGSSRRSSAT